MDTVSSSVLVTGIFILVSATVGGSLGRRGKPYSVWKLILHMILFLFIAAGVVASLYKLHKFGPSGIFSTVALNVLALTVLTNLIVGILMISIKRRNNLAILHKASTVIMILSVIAGLVFLKARI